jgi:hypothetical protein
MNRVLFPNFLQFSVPLRLCGKQLQLQLQLQLLYFPRLNKRTRPRNGS